jgi:hypothetical protein
VSMKCVINPWAKKPCLVWFFTFIFSLLWSMAILWWKEKQWKKKEKTNPKSVVKKKKKHKTSN